jgi:hypothetical protein
MKKETASKLAVIFEWIGNIWAWIVMVFVFITIVMWITGSSLNYMQAISSMQWIFNPFNIFYYLAITILMLPTVGAKALSEYFKNLKLDNEKI